MIASTLARENAEPARPVALTPIFGDMPAELKRLRIWVVWRYRWGGKTWRKVPYIALTNSRRVQAKTNDDRTWRSYDEAKRAYLDGGYDGVGVIVTDDLIGGDFDHAITDGEISDFARAHMPATYAEISPSGEGLRFLAYGAIARPHKTVRCELYDKGSPRFLTLTGHRLEGQPATIERCQAELDRLETALTSEPTARTTRTTGRTHARRERSRKQVAADILTPEVLDEARQLYRTKRESLERRFKAAAKREETQWWFVARRDYAGYHAKYPFVNLYDEHGALDRSQVRMATGRAIKGLGFTLPEYVALMSIYFANDRDEFLARFPTKDAWHEEIADVWSKAAEAKHGFWQPKPDVVIPAKPKGRASDHGAQVERVYQLLQEHRAGEKAMVKTADLAAEAGIHRVTLCDILAELRKAKRITTERFGRYGGLTVSFPDVAIPETLPIETPTAAASLEETHTHNCVSSNSAQPGYSSEAAHSDESTPPLPALAIEYLSTPATAIGRRFVNAERGTVTYQRTAPHFAELVAPFGYERDEAIEAYKAERERQKLLEQLRWKRFYRWLDTASDDVLIAYVGGRVPVEVAALARDESAFDRHEHITRLRKAREAMKKRGLELPARATKTKPVTPHKAEPKVEPTTDTAAMYARLKRVRDQRTQQQVVFGGAS